MADRLRAIVGLGNPGAEYAPTRHNVGFWYVDALASSQGVSFKRDRKFSGEVTRVNVAGAELVLLRPDTFMNNSGHAVQALLSYLKITPPEVLVVHDELDLPPGTVRLKRGGGHGGHNGLRSVTEHIGAEYARLRFGIGHPGHRDRVHDYVLHRPGLEQLQAMQAAIDRALEVLPILLNESWDKATQRLHTEAEAAADKDNNAASKDADK